MAIGPALRGLLASGDSLKVVTFSDAPEVMELVSGAEGRAVATEGPMTPDQIVYCKSFPLWIEPAADATAAELVAQLRGAIQEHTQKTGSAPNVILAKGVGMFAAGADFAAADTARLVYTDAIKVMAGARRIGGVRYMDPGMRKFIEDWEVESYRKSISAAGPIVYKGRTRDTAWYSIIDGEWPALRAAFERWLDPSNFDAQGNQRVSLSSLTGPLVKQRG